MAIAGASYGASKALEEIMAEQMLRAKLEQQQQQDAKRMQMEERRLQEMLNQNKIANDRQVAVDEERAADKKQAMELTGLRRRGQSNMAGVVGMGLEPQTAKRELAFTALNNDVDIPNGVLQAIAPPPEDPMVEYRKRKEIDKEFEKPAAGPKIGTHVVGGNLVDDNGKVLFTAPDKSASGSSGQYSSERAFRTMQSVDELMKQVNNKTVGFGSLLSGVPTTQALSFKDQLNVLKASIAFNELTEMREASKTGGALGPVSDFEGRLLSSSLGALNQAQSVQQMMEQLTKIKASVERWNAAKQKDANQKDPGLNRGLNIDPSSLGAGAPSGKPTAAELIKKYGGG